MVNSIHPSVFSLHKSLVIVIFVSRFDDFLSPCLLYLCVFVWVGMDDGFVLWYAGVYINLAVIDGVFYYGSITIQVSVYLVGHMADYVPWWNSWIHALRDSHECYRANNIEEYVLYSLAEMVWGYHNTSTNWSFILPAKHSFRSTFFAG